MDDKIIQHLRLVAPHFEDAKPLMRAAADRIEALQAERDAAVLAEREACATIADLAYSWTDHTSDVADAIRARGNKEPGQ